MERVKRRIFAGTVCEQIVYPVSERAERPLDAKPRLRFRTEEERARHRDHVAEQRFCRLVNANFDPSCYYGTLTLDAEHEVHTFDDALRLMRNYARRVLRAHPDGLLLLVCGRGKSTERIHFHLLARGIPVTVGVGADGGRTVESDLIRKWGLGTVTQLRPFVPTTPTAGWTAVPITRGLHGTCWHTGHPSRVGRDTIYMERISAPATVRTRLSAVSGTPTLVPRARPRLL